MKSSWETENLTKGRILSILLIICFQAERIYFNMTKVKKSMPCVREREGGLNKIKCGFSSEWGLTVFSSVPIQSLDHIKTASNALHLN